MGSGGIRRLRLVPLARTLVLWDGRLRSVDQAPIGDIEWVRQLTA